MSRDLEARVAAHYARPDLARDILAGLKASGADAAAPTTEDLAPVDEFHTAGRRATLRALELMEPAPGTRVLDAGCGLGGTARVLAAERECRVWGLDLTEEYVTVARLLTERMRLSDRCVFRQGSVLDMPFLDGEFDAAVSFHAAMNIEDRGRFCAELARVVRKDGRVCLFDVMKGAAEGLPFPMPWAQSAETSFLRTPAETRALLEAAGFEVTAEESYREQAVDHFREVFARAEEDEAPPPLGLHLLTGPDAPDKFRNYLSAAEAGQLDPVIMVARRR